MRVPLFILALGVFVMGTAEFIVVGISSTMALELNVLISSIGLMVTFFSIGLLLGGPVMAYVSNLIKPKSALIIFASVFALTNIIAALTDYFWLILTMRLIMGLFYGMYFTGALTLATKLVPEDKQTRAISIIIFGLNMALVIGVPLGTLIGNLYGWQLAFIAIAAMSVIVSIALFFCLPVYEKNVKNAIPAHKQFKLLYAHGMLTGYLIAFLAVFIFAATFTYMTPILQEIFLFSNEYISLLMLLVGVAGLVGNYVAGKMGDKIGARKALAYLFFLYIVTLISLGTLSTQFLGVVLLLAFSFLAFGIAPLLYSNVINIMHKSGNKENDETANGLTLVMISLGLIVGSYFGGVILDYIGLYAIPLIASLFAIIGFVLTLKK